MRDAADEYNGPWSINCSDPEFLALLQRDPPFPGVNSTPHFLFVAPCPQLQGAFWSAHASIFGWSFAACAVLTLLALLVVGRWCTRPEAIALVCSLLTCCLRAAFFLLDPYWAKHWMPPMLISHVYGVVFPIRNIEICHAFFALEKLLATPALRARSRHRLLLVCGVEVIVQAITDTLRPLGYRWLLLTICKIFFVVWGAAVSIIFGVGSVTLFRRYMQARAAGLPKQPAMPRLLSGFALCLAVGILTAVSSALYLSVPMPETLLAPLYTMDHAAEILLSVTTPVLFVPPPYARRMQGPQTSARTGRSAGSSCASSSVYSSKASTCSRPSRWRHSISIISSCYQSLVGTQCGATGQGSSVPQAGASLDGVRIRVASQSQ